MEVREQRREVVAVRGGEERVDTLADARGAPGTSGEAGAPNIPGVTAPSAGGTGTPTVARPSEPGPKVQPVPARPLPGAAGGRRVAWRHLGPARPRSTPRAGTRPAHELARPGQRQRQSSAAAHRRRCTAARPGCSGAAWPAQRCSVRRCVIARRRPGAIRPGRLVRCVRGTRVSAGRHGSSTKVKHTCVPPSRDVS